jgi:hypothetical protein
MARKKNVVETKDDVVIEETQNAVVDLVTKSKR